MKQDKCWRLFLFEKPHSRLTKTCLANHRVGKRELMEVGVENGHFDRIDLICVVQRCAHSKSAGTLLATSQAVEELRMLSGDFVTSDEDMANALSEVAVTLGCSVVFDEQAGADILKLT
jgi:hypothetical protein